MPNERVPLDRFDEAILRTLSTEGRISATELARRLRLKVEETLSYQGTVKIVLIREQRFTEEAR